MKSIYLKYYAIYPKILVKIQEFHKILDYAILGLGKGEWKQIFKVEILESDVLSNTIGEIKGKCLESKKILDGAGGPVAVQGPVSYRHGRRHLADGGD